MIKLPKHDLDRQNAIVTAQNNVGNHTNYLNDVLKPAIETGDWDKFETLDIGFNVTGESLGKIGDNDAWRNLHAFFKPNTTEKLAIDFMLNRKVMERNLRNQLKALALKMIWISPKDYSLETIYNTVTVLKKFTLPLLNEGCNSFELLNFDRLESWVLSEFTDIDFEREQIYVALNKLYTEAKGLPFNVYLTKKLAPSDFGLAIKEAKQYMVIPQRLYYLGLQRSEALVNELYPLRDDLGKLSDYIATYPDKIYQDYAKYLTSDGARFESGKIIWCLSKANRTDKQKAIAFQEAFLALKSPSQTTTFELLYKHKPAIRSDYINHFYSDRTLRVGNRMVTSLGEARSLFTHLNGGCLWALMSRTGMRCDEIFHLHTANGCSKETICKQIIHIILADLSKTNRGSQSTQDEFVTTEVGKKAYEILQALHEPLRKLHPDSKAFFHKVKGELGAITKNGLSHQITDWFESTIEVKLTLTDDDVIDLKVSDPNLSFNVGDTYKFSDISFAVPLPTILSGMSFAHFHNLSSSSAMYRWR